MKQRIITNKITSNLKSSIIELSDKSDYIKIAVAFFSDNEIIRKWVDDKKTWIFLCH